MALTKVTTGGITDATIATADIAADAVTAAKIADDAVGAEHIEQLDADLSFADSAEAKFGAGNDLKIFHDSSNSRSRIQHETDFPLQILQSGNAGMLIQNQNSYNIEIKTNAEDAIKCVANDRVELYHDNTKKFETTANGAVIDGGSNVSMDSSGNGQLKVNGSGYSGAIALDGTAMNIYHNSASRGIIFGINETEKVRLQAGGGISFNGDTAAANALNDYEEGSWTPALYNGTGVTVASASYTKVGNLCNVSAYVTIASNSSSGMVKFNSLPFTAANVGYSIGSAYTQNTGATHVFSQIDGNSTNIIIYKTNGGTVYQSELSGAYVLFSGTYRTT